VCSSARDGQPAALPPRPVLLRIPTGVTFKPGSLSLNWEARRELDSVLRRIRGTSRTITIEAYLDPVASFVAPPYFPKFGWVLSAQRARAVAEYFHSRGEIAYERLVSVGYSSYRPLAMGDTEAAHAVNDRVVVVIYDD
jgi:chemotaxis protein MotB